ncbi:MAG: sporulation protein YqfD [Clostridia bacterium]|nr:sporulation protein YqfD [Clostridia bacterium]
MKHLLRFIFGNVTVFVTKNTSRFLNELNLRDIRYWSLKAFDNGISLCVYRKNFLKLLSVRRKSQSHIKIIKKSGLFQILKNYKKRFGLLIGVLLILFMLSFCSLFIWKIEVIGCKNTKPSEVISSLESLNLHIGRLKKKIVAKDIENEFLKLNKNYSWISVNVKGTTAYIEVNEVEQKPELIDSSEPCSIYAARDGVISSVTSYMGYSVVLPGDTVTAGDLVVTGNYTDKYGVEYMLHSYAKVMAFTEHSHTVTVPYSEKIHIPTGEFKNKYSIKLTRFVIPLYFNKNISYNNYDKTESQKDLKLGRNFTLPFSVIKTTYTEIEHSVLTKSKQSAIQDAYEQLYDFEYSLTGIVINSRNYQQIDNGDSITVKVTLECYEDIGIQGKLDQR